MNFWATGESVFIYSVISVLTEIIEYCVNVKQIRPRNRDSRVRLIAELRFRRGSTRVWRVMPVRLGLSASRRNKLYLKGISPRIAVGVETKVRDCETQSPARETRALPRQIPGLR